MDLQNIIKIEPIDDENFEITLNIEDGSTELETDSKEFQRNLLKDTITTPNGETNLYHSDVKIEPVSLVPGVSAEPVPMTIYAVNAEDVKPFTCSTCGKSFAHNHILKAHLRTHTEVKTYKCTHCSESFDDLNGLTAHVVKNHMTTVVSSERENTGAIDAQPLTVWKECDDGEDWDEVNEPYHCTACETTFEYRAYALSHNCPNSSQSKINRGKRYEGICCPVCKKSFAQKQTLKQHILIHKDERPFPCLECGMAFRQKFSLERHLKTHSSEKPYRCIVCDKMYSDHPSYKEHCGSHTDAEWKSVADTGISDLKNDRDRIDTMDEIAEVKPDVSNEALENEFVETLEASMPTTTVSRPADTASVTMGSAMAPVKLFLVQKTGANNFDISVPTVDQIDFCKVCYQRLPRKNAPHQCQLQWVKQGARNYSCPICAKEFSEHYRLKSHMRTHSGERPFKCPDCPKTFRHSYSVKVHQRGAHLQEKKPYQCNLCDDDFVDLSSLREHCLTHHSEDLADNLISVPLVDSEVGEIDEAGASGSLKKLLKVQTRSHDTMYHCKICDKQFRFRTDVLAHACRKPPPRKRKYEGVECPVCKKTYAQRHTLKLHMRIHTGEKPFTCSVCKKPFRHNHALKLHMRIHTGERPNICVICGKGFVDLSNLKAHIRYHTGEKPFQCVMCGKTFSQKAKLQEHHRNHTGEKPYSCSICTATFRWNSQLSAHIKVHNNKERPEEGEDMVLKSYKCLMCDTAFSTKNNLTLHMATHSD